MFILKQIFKFFSVLNSNQKPEELAGGIAFALLLGLVPAGNLTWWGVIILTYFLKVNFGIEMLFLVLFKLLAFLVAGPQNSLGVWILTQPSLQGLFTRWANTPIVPFTRFNNGLVMGGLVIGILAWLPSFFLFQSLVKAYRKHLQEKIAKSKFVKAIKKAPLISGLVRLSAKASKLKNA